MADAIVENIASQMGVSARTVQRILSGELKDKRPTILERAGRIRKLAAAMNYRPNMAARAVARGRFGCVSLIRPASAGRGHYSRELSNGIEEELALHDMYLTVHRLPDEQLQQPGFLPSVLRTAMSDGLLLNWVPAISAAMRQVIEREIIPTVWVNTKMPADCAYPDDEQAGRLATTHLIERGYRRIAYVLAGDLGGHHSEADRRQGYGAAMREAGLAPRAEQVRCGTEDRCAALRQWLERSDRPEAVVTYSSATGQPLMVAALLLGLRVPQDLAIATIEDRVPRDLGLAMTTVRLEVAEMGRQAVRMLIQKIKEPGKQLAPIIVPGVLEAGQTS
jgi:DNA-binding LacI/PurR family transcriptional regulator